jgi:hypothetical protein
LVGYQAAFAGKPRAYRKSEAERRTLLILTPHQAERRFCAVGNPAGMADAEQDRSEGMPSTDLKRGKSPWLLGAFPSDPP